MTADKPTGLYGWIQSNDGRSTGLFVGFLLAMQVICAVNLFLPLALIDSMHAPFLNWGGYFTRYAPLMLVGSVLWFGWALFWHVETVKKAVGFKFVDDHDEPRLCSAIEPLIIMMGLPIPFVGVIESPARNAFACGIARKKAVVVVTRGLIDDLNDEELACVLAHELSHIKNGDIRLMAAANIFMARLKLLHKNNALRFTPVHVVLALAIPVILPLTLIGSFLGHAVLRAGQALRLLVASPREFIADAEAVQLTKNPAAMASALVKVEHDYRVPGARNEEDAMMIAGDSEGGDATHPTMAQRIAALARTTGSMVFNAPGAIQSEHWESSPTLSEANAAALLRALPPSRVLSRVRAGSNANLLGLTNAGMIMALVTIAGLLWLHAGELNDARAMAAKFDVRPLTVMLGKPVSCQFVRALELSNQECEVSLGSGAYREFEGQKNTLAGVLADISKKRREQGVVNSDVTFGGLGTDIVRREYTGVSGRMKGVMAEMTPAGDFPIGNDNYSSAAPEHLTIAELDQVGCFPGKIMHDEPKGRYRIDQEAAGGSSMRHYLEMANGSLIVATIPHSDGDESTLHKYVEKRQNLLRASFDLYGFPGLRLMLKTYLADDHAELVAKLRERMKDPAFTKDLKPLTLAMHRALARQPEAFVPCVALSKLSRDEALLPVEMTHFSS